LEIRDSIYTYYCATTRKRSGRDRLYNNTHHTDLLRANRQIYNEAVNYLYDRIFSIYIVCEEGRMPEASAQILAIFDRAALRRVKSLDIYIYFHFDSSTVVSDMSLDCLQEMVSLQQIGFLLMFDRNIGSPEWPELDILCRFPSPLVTGLVVSLLAAVPKGVDVSWITSDQGAELGRNTPGRNNMAAMSDGESDIDEDASDALSEGWDQSSQDDFLVPSQLLQ